LLPDPAAERVGRAGMEDAMKKILLAAAFAAVSTGSPVAAHHVDHLNDAFASRGACEVEKNALSNTDDWLMDAFPDIFSSEGEVRSFLNRAFPCELNPTDGQWYMIDKRLEVLSSDWMQRRMR
jgi:hypothetical protein